MLGQVFPAYYWVHFKNKNNSSYSISNPSAYLSARAITRRSQQGIAIDSTDLPLNAIYVNAVLATGAVLHSSSKWLNSITVNVSSDSVLQQIQALACVAGTDYTKPGAIPPMRMSADKGKWNFPTFGSPVVTEHTGGLEHHPKSSQSVNYGQAYNQVHQINLDALHDIGLKGDGVIIAVLDGGFLHADTIAALDSLWLNNQIIASKDFVAPQHPNIYGSASHGTMVLSIMGANLPGQMVGTAPRAKYILLRSEDVDTEFKIEEDNWASAAEYADSAGVDVINSSLGYSVYNDPIMDHPYADMNGNTARCTIAADFAAQKGIVVCISAGNSGGSAWQYVSSPADGDSVFTIGAVDDLGIYASFSSTGPTADGRLKPNVCAQGQGTIVASPYGMIYPGNGTSFSSPVIAGATACLRQAFPSMPNMQLIKAIEQSADHYNNPDSLYGYGIPNFAIANLILEASIPPNLDAGLEPRIIPNPATDIVKISFSSSDTQDVVITMLDLQGKQVMDTQVFPSISGAQDINLQLPVDLTHGLYFLRISTAKKTFLKKLVKI